MTVLCCSAHEGCWRYGVAWRGVAGVAISNLRLITIAWPADMAGGSVPSPHPSPPPSAGAYPGDSLQRGLQKERHPHRERWVNPQKIQ